MGFGKRIDITIEDKTVSVRDFGRGIPLNKVIDATSKLNTGGKFDTANFQKSVGMNGVGTKAVNAMSSDFYVASYRDGETSWARFSQGILQDSGMGPTTEKDGTFIRFTPDEQMFEGWKPSFSARSIASRLCEGMRSRGIVKWSTTTLISRNFSPRCSSG